MPTVAQIEIVELDRSLAVDGEDFVLRRVIGAGHQANVDVLCRGFVRGYAPEELTETIIQGDAKVILSPSQIIRAQWPGGESVAGAGLDRRVPRRGDKAIIQGKARNIEAAMPIYIADELVRIELQTRG
jgi:hypothetical protein